MEMFIDGAWSSARGGRRRDVVNPATGEIVDSVPEGDAEDADLAIRSSARAFETWRKTPVAERARLQRAAARLMRERAGELGKTIRAELGRPLFPGFSAPATQQLLTHAWPGNVRELRNAVERSLARHSPSTPLPSIALNPFGPETPPPPTSTPTPTPTTTQSEFQLPCLFYRYIINKSGFNFLEIMHWI